MKEEKLHHNIWVSPTMPFGKYEGLPVAFLPSSYLDWMARTLSDTELVWEALVELKIRDYVDARFRGQVCGYQEYIVELEGDYGWVCDDRVEFGVTFPDMFLFPSLEDALEFLEEYAEPDVEDDRILIWEVLEAGHRKVVWHFSGWHFNPDEYGEQGKLPGHDRSLYEEQMDEN